MWEFYNKSIDILKSLTTVYPLAYIILYIFDHSKYCTFKDKAEPRIKSNNLIMSAHLFVAVVIFVKVQL